MNKPVNWQIQIRITVHCAMLMLDVDKLHTYKSWCQSFPMTLPSRNDYISHLPEWMAIPMVCLKPPTHIKCNKATGTSRSNKSGKQVLEQYLINAVCSFWRGTFWRRTSTWEVVEYYSLSPICSLTSKHSQIKFRTCIPDLKTCRRGSVTLDVRR